MSNQDTWHGLGRRKSAIAKVLLSGEFKEHSINGLSLDKYFTTIGQRQAAVSPLELTGQQESLGMKVKVLGGGKQSQADAVKLGIARALLEINPEWRKQLKVAGMLTRDPRVKERKKFGLKRARRAPQFSKR